MKRIFRLVASLFAPPPDPTTESAKLAGDDLLREKLAKWNEQAREYEALGFSELARHCRESIRAHERSLACRQLTRRAA